MVDRGQRFCDEAAAYMEIGQRMFRRHANGRAVPSWVIMDADSGSISLGTAARTDPKAWLDSDI